METKEILSELEREYKPAEGSKKADKAKADKFNAVRHLLKHIILILIFTLLNK